MIAYIILAHKGPRQVARMAARLAEPRSRLFIHIDRKVDDAPFHAAMADDIRDNVEWIDRVDTRWAEYSLVQATLNGLDAVRRSARPFGHIILLSGQSYPLRPPPLIHGFLSSQAGCSFVSCIPMPGEKMSRLDRYYYTLRGWRRVYPPLEPAQTLKGRCVNALCRLRFRMPRRHPSYARPHFGSQWWCLSVEAVEAIRVFLNAHPDYARFYRHTSMPDEGFFQTILAAETTSGRAGRLIHHDVQYADWDDEKRPSPRILTLKDFDRLASSDCLFARKFDTAVDAGILDLIDQRLLGT